MGIFGPSTMLIEGNQIMDAGGDGITIGESSAADGVDPMVRGNTITSSGTGISVRSKAKPTIEGNVLEANRNGVVLNGSDAVVSGNQIRGHVGVGIAAPAGGAPVIQGNVLEDNAQAIAIWSADGPVISDNNLCGNGVDYRSGGDVAPLPPGNTTCAPASGAPSAAP
jgi:parallel beta-helix repeat protein